MAKIDKHNLPPEEMYKLKYQHPEYYKLQDKLLGHKHFLGGYIFGDNQLAVSIEFEVESYGLKPNNELITDFLYSNHQKISKIVEDIVGQYLSELLEFIAEQFVSENLEELESILGKESEKLGD